MQNAIPQRWLLFWIYIRIPLGILMSLNKVTNINFPSWYRSSVLTTIILSGFVFQGLRKRLKWGWRLNFLLLGIEAFYYLPMNFASKEKAGEDYIIAYLIGLVICGVVWFVPNYLYFKRRESLFT